MVKVIGAGFGRTGTTSLKAALEHIGFGPCFHMYELLAQPEKMTAWLEAANGEHTDWPRLFDGYESTVDWPATAFWKQLVEDHPDAKVILTTRDSDRWYDSTFNTIYSIANNPQPSAGAEVDEVLAKFRPMQQKLIWQGTFDGRFADREHAIRVFEEHNAEVERTVPADRLLSFQVKDGWKPLCDFLGVEVPEQDFPHINDTASMPELIQQIRTQGKVPSPLTD